MYRFLFLALIVSANAASAAFPERWTTPIKPFRIHGVTYYVGTVGLGSILLTSKRGHVLIDAPMQENAALIEANIRALGFRVEDVKLIVNSHAHFDHAGAIASIAKDSGASVRATTAGAKALRSGGDDGDDPQHGEASGFPAVAEVNAFADGETLRVGKLALTAHATPGHTPGSTTWTWRSCEAKRCIDLVYADSLSAISAEGFRFSDPAYPDRVRDFRRGLATIAALPCDVLITPHPEASGFLDRVQRRDAGDADALIEDGACRRYAETAGKNLDARLADEAKK